MLQYALPIIHTMSKKKINAPEQRSPFLLFSISFPLHMYIFVCGCLCGFFIYLSLAFCILIAFKFLVDRFVLILHAYEWEPFFASRHTIVIDRCSLACLPAWFFFHSFSQSFCMCVCVWSNQLKIYVQFRLKFVYFCIMCLCLLAIQRERERDRKSNSGRNANNNTNTTRMNKNVNFTATNEQYQQNWHEISNANHFLSDVCIFRFWSTGKRFNLNRIPDDTKPNIYGFITTIVVLVVFDAIEVRRKHFIFVSFNFDESKCFHSKD